MSVSDGNGVVLVTLRHGISSRRIVESPKRPSTSKSEARSPRRKSASTSSTRVPASAMVMARLLATVDFPSPGIELVTSSDLSCPWFGMKSSEERRLRKDSAKL